MKEILTILSLGNKLERESVARSGSTIGSGVVGAVNDTVASASGVAAAEGAIPGVARVAIGIAILVMNPTPIGINDDLTILVGAASLASALLPSYLGVSLGLLSTNTLGAGKASSGQESRESEELGLHGQR
jgi:hypothetical protein